MPKISIIIATYNRGTLIIETLKKIQLQNYENWECLIIDDGSTDGTGDIIAPFIAKDSRFLYRERPVFISKGANACRNYGFTIAQGQYIKFFDSDDLMLSSHLKICIEFLLSRKLDYVVSDCRNFDEDGLRERPYETDKNYISINAEDFAKFRNGWITNDLLVSRELAEKLNFNEEIRDVASEYQYCIRLLLLSKNGLLIPDILTYRRVHKESIFVQMTNNEIKWKSLVAENKLFTLMYVEDLASLKLKKWLLSGYMQFSFDIACANKWPLHIFKGFIKISKEFNTFKAFAFLIAIGSGVIFKKGYRLLKYARTPFEKF